MKIFSIVLISTPLVVGFSVGTSAASAGTEGASFLNIPVGAEPAALGSAYSAAATNAYAPTWNPGAMSRADETQLAVEHLSYLEAMHYEYAGFVRPFGKGQALGVSVQYFGTGNIQALDATGNSIGSITSHYGAYGLAYGRDLNSRLSLGVTGKMIEAAIDNVTAHTFAADFGSFIKVNDRLQLAGVVTNLGGKLKFIDQADNLPTALHLGGSFAWTSQTSVMIEGVYDRDNLANLHTGVEWKPVHELALRAGYRTDIQKNLTAIAGFSAGMGVNILGQTFSYAWVPFGDLGNTHYFSLLIRFNEFGRKDSH